MPASQEVSYARLLRPFPTKRLTQILRYIHADAAAIEAAEQRLLIDPPATPEEWRYELDAIDTLLWSLAERAREAQPRIQGLSRDADHSFRAATEAMRVLMSGLRVSDSSPPLAPVEPECVPQDVTPANGLKSPQNGSGVLDEF